MKKRTPYITAYCFRSGNINFSYPSRVPKGAIAFISGARDRVVATIEATARLAYDNSTWLVPGIPEAVDDEVAFQALETYAKRVHETFSKAVSRTQEATA